MGSTLAVAVNVYQEPRRQIEECLSRIARNLSTAAVTVFLNGRQRREVECVAEPHGFRVIEGENLGTNVTWSLWWLRVLRFFREANADVCFKFDPDTMVDASPKAIPSADYFGTVWLSRRYRIPFIQGGVTGLSRRAVCNLLDSSLLALEVPGASVVTEECQSLADDQYMAMALAKLGIRPTAWTECCSQWRTPVANGSNKFAIVHPRYYS